MVRSWWRNVFGMRGSWMWERIGMFRDLCVARYGDVMTGWCHVGEGCMTSWEMGEEDDVMVDGMVSCGDASFFPRDFVFEFSKNLIFFEIL